MTVLSSFLFTLSERRDIVSIRFVTSPDRIALENKTELNEVKHDDYCLLSSAPLYFPQLKQSCLNAVKFFNHKEKEKLAYFFS